MTKKYKELPAFETNEFKVGDLVRVYDSEVSEDIESVEEINFNRIKLKNYPYYVHFKTCRKLEEVMPREFYIFKQSIDGVKIPEDEIKANKWIAGSYIKVREVLEDEE